MSFDAAWLDLREPADAAARDPGCWRPRRRYLGGGAAPVALDLGCGTGATVRAFGTRAGGALAAGRPRPGAARRLRGAACRRAETVAADLADLDALPLAGVRLVTASALFDLASRRLDRGAGRRGWRRPASASMRR